MNRSRGALVRTATIIAVALVLVFGVLPLVGMWLMMGSMMRPGAIDGFFWPSVPMMGGWPWLLMIAGFLIVLGLTLLGIWGVSRVGGEGSTGGEAPLAILQRRYASGEIGREEYDRIRADLVGEGTQAERRPDAA